MGRMKQLAVDFIEFEDEITDIISRAKIATPITYELLFDNNFTIEAKRGYFHNFTNDKELVDLVITYVEYQHRHDKQD